MEKRFLLFVVIFFSLIQPVSFAKPIDVRDLPQAEQDQFNALSPEIQSETLQRLQKMGHFDPEHTHIDKTGRIFIVDDSLEKIMQDNGLEMPLNANTLPQKKVISNNPPSGFTPEGIPIFHSFPGSPNVLYLNFLGAVITGTAWNDFYMTPSYSAQPYIPAAYNPNRTPGFPPAVQNAIAKIWARVTEDYAPWQIDVTTEAPASYTNTTAVALITSSITTDGKPMPSNTAGGVAFLDAFGFSDYAYYRPALIYYNNLGNGQENFVAEAVSHEIGHNFGLSHEGIVNGTSYWTGTGSGEISWGCIMGAAYFVSVGKFCSGDYPNANNQEDQVAMITSSIPLRVPSAGNSIANATPLPITNGAFKFTGIIENYTTSDFFALNNAGGTISVTATTFRSTVDTLGNNLCMSLKLLDSSGNVIASSNNPQTCSATLSASSLPFGNYYVQVYPVGNVITPFSVYGSMGQYDLAGTSSVGKITLSPQYSTLALNSNMNFDANDTVHVLNGIPPYTFKANLNSFSKTGATYTYVASTPGLDTITVTDSHGNTASARVTVSYMDFGGMYGYSKIGNYNNPITGTLGCPSGYTSQEVMGTVNVDYPLFYCYRMHANGVPANYDFGGIYSYSGSGLRPNPSTGGASCPAGYSSAQVFGESSNSPDYPAYFCYKTHNEAIPEAVPFAGMYAPAATTSYNNPATGKLSCPTCTISTMMLGTFNVDYAFYFCAYPPSPLKISPQYTNMALNSTMTFDTNDTARVSGGNPPFTYSATLGTFTQSGTTNTYKASKPGLDTITVTDSKGHVAKAKVTVAYVDFGGMYGNSINGNFNNPTTGTFACPAGYLSQQLMGTAGVDYPLYYCYRMHTNGIPADYDFGGVYSGSGSGPRINPITSASSCPTGYTSVQVYGDSSNVPDYPAYLCYKVHNESVAEAAHFGGMYAPANATSYNNPITGAQNCPAGWSNTMMLGTFNVDYPFYFCY